MTTEAIIPAKEKAKKVFSVFNMMLQRAETGIAKAKVDVAKFAADIQTDRSAYHFEWAAGYMKSAAYGKVSQQIHNSLMGGATLMDVYNDLQGRIQHGAKYPEFSTSPTSNLMSQYTLSAYADYAETLRGFINHLTSTTDEA